MSHFNEPRVKELVKAYPELVKAQNRVIDILRQEEERFFETIEHGMGILEATLKTLPAGGTFDGELAFKLHDTYGFPLDLTADVCRERGVTVDSAGFDAAMNREQFASGLLARLLVAMPPWRDLTWNKNVVSDAVACPSDTEITMLA